MQAPILRAPGTLFARGRFITFHLVWRSGTDITLGDPSVNRKGSRTTVVDAQSNRATDYIVTSVSTRYNNSTMCAFNQIHGASVEGVPSQLYSVKLPPPGGKHAAFLHVQATVADNDGVKLENQHTTTRN
ncbi:hypothetical protein CBL_01337 [Carabus blaptoides fortunei]